MNIKKDIRLRVYITFTFICLFGVAIIVKAALIQMNEGPTLRVIAKEARTRTMPLIAERGNIYTENGSLLSSSVPQFDVHVDFSVMDSKLFNKNVDSLALCLSHLFNDESKDQYKQELLDGFNSKDRYYTLRKNLPYYQYEAIRSFPIFNKGKNTGGFIEDPKEKRINPYGMLAYRTIGLWRENSQTIGLEATYDTILRGSNGSRLEEKLTGNTWVPIDGSDVEAQDGKDLVTTIDIGIQDVAEHALLSVLKQYNCAYGTCIVMEVSTGKIRAMVNLGEQKDSSNYWEDYNYAMMPTEPGSTFKLVTLISLLNDKYVTINDNVDAEGGAVHFGDRVMHDSHMGMEIIPIWKAFAASSNAAMAKLAYTHYNKNPKQYVDHLIKLHLNERTGIDLLGERRPYVKTPDDKSWSKTTLPWMATGYEVMITPLHTCMLYNAVANGGKMMKPYLVSSIREYGKDVKKIQPTVLVDKIAEPFVIEQLKKCTQAVVSIEGTAKSIESPYYKISGKTGTAQVADKGISYTDGVYQGSFVGYFPSEKPKYTICVVIRTKAHSNEYYGGTIAAPVFRMVSDKIFATNIGSWEGQMDSISKSKDNKAIASKATVRSYKTILAAMGKSEKVPVARAGTIEQLSIDSTKKLSVLPQAVYHGIVPDVTGMGLKDAVYLLEVEGLQVKVQGKGRVQLQSITPGTRIIKGQNIILQLS